MIDAHQIKGKLWQGSYPHPDDGEEFGRRFDTIVFTAPSDHRPDPRAFKPADCVFVGLRDGYDVKPDEARSIVEAVAYVDAALHEDQRVLVTCRQGANRSGVVVAGVLMVRWGLSAAQATRLVQSKRVVPTEDPNGKWGDDWRSRSGRRRAALYNDDYVEYLKTRFDDDFDRWIRAHTSTWVELRHVRGAGKAVEIRNTWEVPA